jgi:hypothetical protein
MKTGQPLTLQISGSAVDQRRILLGGTALATVSALASAAPVSGVFSLRHGSPLAAGDGTTARDGLHPALAVSDRADFLRHRHE